jgi:hypothetical protein
MKTKPTHHWTLSTIKAAFAAAVALLIGGCATTTTAPRTPPAATVKIQEWSAAYYGSAATGKGTLHYNGQKYKFSISSLGVGGMGGQKISATGKVYNLSNIGDFAGTYTGISQGLTLIEGQMHAKLTNGNGVILYIAGETEGLASSIGAQTFQVALGN